MLWMKALHIVLVASWFAGLFYLPRIFVNLAMVPADSVAERERLLLMADKLLRFMTLLAPLAIILGLILWQRYGIGKGMGWIHAKLLIVLFTVLYHGYCAVLLQKIKAGKMHSHTWYRWFNEIPVLLFLAATLLVTVKPF